MKRAPLPLKSCRRCKEAGHPMSDMDRGLCIFCAAWPSRPSAPCWEGDAIPSRTHKKPPLPARSQQRGRGVNG